MKISEIINEADVRIPNSYDVPQKAAWLNEINHEFFDVVKIPQTFLLTTISNVSNYTVSTNIRAKNITKVHVGKGIYPSFLYDNVPPGQNYHLFQDATNTLSLVPTPTAGLPCIIKYYQIPTTTFVGTDLNASPDAPLEYHWIYILGLCERIAKSMPDVSLANNYATDYKSNLLVAQQNYAQG